MPNSENSSTQVEAQKDSSSNSEPNVIFKRMIDRDAAQNERISKKISPRRDDKKKSSTGSEYAGDRTRVRFLIAVLGLMSLAMSQMARMVLNTTITQMIHPDLLKMKDDNVSTDGSCPWPVVDEPKEIEIMPANGTDSEVMLSADVLDVDEKNVIYKVITGQFDPSQATESEENENNGSEEEFEFPVFKWDSPQRNILLGGFYFSYFVFMVIGGWMAEMYGAKYVLQLSVAGSALICGATPWMASFSYGLLLSSRIAMGAIQAGVFPGMYALFSKWLTKTEAGVVTPLIKMFLRLGMLFGTAAPSIIRGWPNVFYFTSIVCCIWSCSWLLIATSTPDQNAWVSESELAHIMRKKRKIQLKSDEIESGIEMETKKNGDVNGTATGKDTDPGSKSTKASKSKRKKTPWAKILTSHSVIGLIVVKLSFNFALDFLAIQLPTYLKLVHHASKEQIGWITGCFYLIQVVLIIFIGHIAELTLKKRPYGASKTIIRKVFQAIASYGLGFGLVLLTLNNCNLIYVAVLLQFISLLSMFTAGGETMLPYDLSDEFPATIMAIANSIANTSGVFTTLVANLVLRKQSGSFYRWNILILLIAGANIIGATLFMLLVKAEPINFDDDQKVEEKERKEKQLGDLALTLGSVPAVVGIAITRIED